MKLWKTSALVIVLALSFSSAIAANTVRLSIQHMLNGSEFALMKVARSPEGSYEFIVTELRYYLSNIIIVHDGGQRTRCQDVFLLVDANNPSMFELGIYDITNVEGIEFGVGIDQIYNHLDPSTYPPGHPLGHQNPSMHWGWAAGYRFCTFEGKAAPSNAESGNVFQIHSTGDKNYQTVALPVNASFEQGPSSGTLTIPIKAEYAGLLTNINVSPGVITHGDYAEAATLMVNFDQHVFTPGLVSDVDDDTDQRGMNNQSQLLVYPNPTVDVVYINTSMLNMVMSSSWQGAGPHVAIYDAAGLLVAEQSVENMGLMTVSTDGLAAGVYRIVMYTSTGTVSGQFLKIH